MNVQPDADRHLRHLLTTAGVRPTGPRVALARLLFDDAPKHVTAQEVHLQAANAGLSVSMATVYNTLAHLTEVGLLREVVVDPARVHYDTRLDPHCHVYDLDTGALRDLDLMPCLAEPELQPGEQVVSVDVIYRVKSR